MTAAEKKIILEKGSDYRLQLLIKDDGGIANKDLDGWSWVFNVYSKTDVTTPAYTFSSEFSGDFPGEDLTNGACTVHIDSASTSTMNTLIPEGEDPFMTDYNYYYTLTLSGPEGTGTLDDNREMRVLRGKLAVRV